MASLLMSLQIKLLLILLSHIITASANSNNYIIYMDTNFMPETFSNHHDWYIHTVSSILDKSNPTSTSQLIYSYNHVFHGFSAHLSPSELEALEKNSPGFLYSIRDTIVKLHTTHSYQFLGLNAPLGAWKASSYGDDVVIGFVDTGVWPESESYNDEGMRDVPARWKGRCETGTQFDASMCNKKLIGARYFNKGVRAVNPNLTIVMNSARDVEGHGTHTSSTGAGRFVTNASFFGYAPGKASGAAPMARVAIYKALWEEVKNPSASDVIAAIEQAIIDGVDVISLSFGVSPRPLHQDPVAIATFAAMRRGIFVSTSAGNEGPLDGFLHNGIPWALTVAASEMDRRLGGTITLGSGVTLIGETLFPGHPSSIGKTSLIFLGDCKNTTEMNIAGRNIGVCEDRDGSLYEQLDKVENSKLIAGIFITDDFQVEAFFKSSFPTIFLSSKDGKTTKDYIDSCPHPKGRIEFRKTLLGIKPAPKVAEYSSRGPARSCPTILKPDITGPGSFILAAWPSDLPTTIVNNQPQYSNYNLLSGTSMSCPHLAGVAALLRAVHKEWTPAAIRSALMTTANSMDNTNAPIKDIGKGNMPATPLAMGAGHVNPNKALNPGLVYDAAFEDYVNFLCSLNYTSKQIQAITATASIDCSSPTMDLNYPSFIAFFHSNNASSGTGMVQEFKRTMTNVADGGATYTANVMPLKGFRVRVIPRRLVFNGKHDKRSYKLSIERQTEMEEHVIFGFIQWVDGRHEHVVTSPVVVTNYKC